MHTSMLQQMHLLYPELNLYYYLIGQFLRLIGEVIILLSAVIAERNPKPKTIENGEINL